MEPIGLHAATRRQAPSGSPPSKRPRLRSPFLRLRNFGGRENFTLRMSGTNWCVVPSSAATPSTFVASVKIFVHLKLLHRSWQVEMVVVSVPDEDTAQSVPTRSQLQTGNGRIDQPGIVGAICFTRPRKAQAARQWLAGCLSRTSRHKISKELRHRSINQRWRRSPVKMDRLSVPDQRTF
jgi:hypothetical protein